MQKVRLFGLIIGVAILVVLGLWLGAMALRWVAMSNGPKSLNTATVIQQVQTLSQLVTVKYVMEKVVVVEDVKWFGDNRVLLVAHGVVKAGVDFGQMKAEDVDISGKSLSVCLPHAQITDAYLDDKQTRVVERSTGLLRLFDKDLEQTARQSPAEPSSSFANFDILPAITEAYWSAPKPISLFATRIPIVNPAMTSIMAIIMRRKNTELAAWLTSRN